MSKEGGASARITDMDKMDLLRETINLVLEEDGLPKAKLEQSTPLMDVGLDSLGFAIVIARLEKTVGFDPFTEGNIEHYPTSFGEFVEAYANFVRIK